MFYNEILVLTIVVVFLLVLENIVILRHRKRFFLGLEKLITGFKNRGIQFVIDKLKEKINFQLVLHGFKTKPKNFRAMTRTISFSPFNASINIHEEYNDDLINIAFYPTGGMGDYIISAVILEEIQEICQCNIDVFVEKTVFGNSIYGGRKNVEVKKATDYESMIPKYDLALKVEHFIHVDGWKQDRLLLFSKNLYDRIKYIKDNWDKLYVDIPQQCWRERVQFERCRLLGLNRWTELRMGKAFAVKQMKVTIPMNTLYEEEYKKQDFYSKKYITINYGADAMKIGMKQLKLWSKGYLVEFVRLFKKKYPDFLVVQLGGKDAEKIKGVDYYVLGKSFELTKYIIRDSSCHVDCEGGLVHLAAQFDTKSVVVFGPTPVHMYGYPQNVNIVSEKCSNCMGLHKEWAYECYCCGTGCMEDITAEMVLGEILLN